MYAEICVDCLDIINKGISYFLEKNEIPNPVLYFVRSVYKRDKNQDYMDDYEKAILIASLAKNEELVNNFKRSKKAYDDWIGSGGE